MSLINVILASEASIYLMQPQKTMKRIILNEIMILKALKMKEWKIMPLSQKRCIFCCL